MRYFLVAGEASGDLHASALIRALRERDPEASFAFMGGDKMQEASGVAPLVHYREVAFMGVVSVLKNLRKLTRIGHRVQEAIRSFQPDVVIGTGGYASAPTLKIAQWLGIPSFIQEQNSYAGVTNKWVARGAKGVFVAYDHMQRYFPHSPIFLTGNPIREEVIDIKDKNPEAFASFSLDPDAFTLVVIGGSLGARKINELVKTHLDFFQEKKVQILWQCGSYYFEEYRQYDSPQVRVLPFVEDMKAAFAIADVILSRAGASTVSELAVVGKPVIFVPSPNVAEDHQTKNAQAIADQNAALLLREADIASHFAPMFSTLWSDPAKRKELSDNFRKLARPHATQEIVNIMINEQ